MARHASSRPRPSVLMPAGLALTVLGAGLLGGTPTALAAEGSGAGAHPGATSAPLPPSVPPSRTERPETETTAAISDVWPRGATTSGPGPRA